MNRPFISKEAIEEIKGWLPSDKQTIRYWLETGIPDGIKLEDSYPQELIDEVKKEMAEEVQGWNI